MKKNYLLIGLTLLLTSCFGPQYLQTKLNENKYPLGYLHDMQTNNKKNDFSIFPSIFDKSDTISVTSVKVDKKRILYLIFMYSFDYNYTIQLGKKSITPKLIDFILSSFIKESEKNGMYYVNNDTISKKYKLTIDILEYNVTTKYHEQEIAWGGYREWTTEVQPSSGILKLKATLYNSESTEMFSKIYTSNKSTDFVKSRAYSQNETREHAMQNMSETLSQCLKDNIEEIVTDMNAILIK